MGQVTDSAFCESSTSDLVKGIMLSRSYWAAQENGIQNDVDTDCTGNEVTSSFTANVWEVGPAAHLADEHKTIPCEQTS